jgi:hypothetical protein
MHLILTLQNSFLSVTILFQKKYKAIKRKTRLFFYVVYPYMIMKFNIIELFLFVSDTTQNLNP